MENVTLLKCDNFTSSQVVFKNFNPWRWILTMKNISKENLQQLIFCLLYIIFEIYDVLELCSLYFQPGLKQILMHHIPSNTGGLRVVPGSFSGFQGVLNGPEGLWTQSHFLPQSRLDSKSAIIRMMCKSMLCDLA